MGAGLSQKQIYCRVYSRLRGIQRELHAAGVQATHRRSRLAVETPRGRFEIAFMILRASNGEVCGLPEIRVFVAGKGPKTFGHRRFKAGMRFLKRAFCPRQGE